MHLHVVWCAVSVFVSEVMNSTDCHGDLADGVYNGQVDDGSVWSKCQDRLEILSLQVM